MSQEPRKHAELIKAWADGAQIQYYSPVLEEWKDVTTPVWDRLADYRLKPVKVKKVPTKHDYIVARLITGNKFCRRLSILNKQISLLQLQKDALSKRYAEKLNRNNALMLGAKD